MAISALDEQVVTGANRGLGIVQHIVNFCEKSIHMAHTLEEKKRLLNRVRPPFARVFYFLIQLTTGGVECPP